MKQQTMPKKNKINKNDVKVIDLFCGIGGLTHGFQKEGFNVIAGIDNDGSCRYGYEANNDAIFIEKPIEEVSKNELLEKYDNCKYKVLVGCAPCQPYSRLNLKKDTEKDFSPIEKFAKLINEIHPEIVSMENVRGLKKYPVFQEFVDNLKSQGYKVSFDVVDTSDYGIPQKRMRLVLLASLLGEIKLIDKTTEDPKKKKTVRDMISNLPKIKDGEISKDDIYHRSRKLNPLNKKRIKATKHNGGSTNDWSEELVLECHKKDSGKTYKGTVYGRMRWDEPAPTMTTQCIGIGNGRYGHPEQDRAISLREAALFQTFPKTYKFVDPKKDMKVGDVAKFIGNAVPVKLGQVIAKSISNHIKQYS